jgi:hypothetical protein
MPAIIKERPILFSAPMVLAILEGRKTQTRRVVKKQHGQPGDRLWVRETWAAGADDGPVELTCKPSEMDPLKTSIYFRACKFPQSAFCWRPSIFMPRWASRITLEITGVRVERLQDISGNDVLAEGVDNGKSNTAMGKSWESMQRMAYADLWERINGPGSWSLNPWVWVIEFRRIA